MDRDLEKELRKKIHSQRRQLRRLGHANELNVRNCYDYGQANLKYYQEDIKIKKENIELHGKLFHYKRLMFFFGWILRYL